MTDRERRQAERVRLRQEKERRRHWREAVENWKSLEEPDQLRIVCEIVETRGRELVKAFRGVASVGWGYGTRCVKRRASRKQKPGSGKQGATTRRLRDDVCVTFVVRHKLTLAEMRVHEKDGELPAWAVPRYLMHYVGEGDQRRLCAVPTDVEHVASHRYRGHDARIAVARNGGATTVTAGSATCVVRRPGVQSKLYVLSCRHVLGMMDQVGTSFQVGALVSRCSDPAANAAFSAMPPTLAKTTGFYGLMFPGGPDDASNFDAAMAEITGNLQALRPLVPRMTPDPDPNADNPYEPFATDILSLDEAVLHAPDGPKRVDPTRLFPAGGLPMKYNGVTGLFYMQVPLIQYLPIDRPPAPGDSGSPVTNVAGDKLLGMHIGGSDDGHPRPFGVMIPAFELLDPANFIGLGSGELLRIVVDF